MFTVAQLYMHTYCSLKESHLWERVRCPGLVLSTQDWRRIAGGFIFDANGDLSGDICLGGANGAGKGFGVKNGMIPGAGDADQSYS